MKQKENNIQKLRKEKKKKMVEKEESIENAPGAYTSTHLNSTHILTQILCVCIGGFFYSSSSLVIAVRSIGFIQFSTDNNKYNISLLLFENLSNIEIRSGSLWQKCVHAKEFLNKKNSIVIAGDQNQKKKKRKIEPKIGERKRTQIDDIKILQVN